jgi:hypothetical protein
MKFLLSLLLLWPPFFAFAQSHSELPEQMKMDWAKAYVQSIDSAKSLTAISSYSEFKPGEVLVIQSRDKSQKIIGFVEVFSIENQGDDRYTIKANLIRQSKFAMIQQGDVLYKMDFKTFHEEYKGTTELIMKNDDADSSASYKPLVYMGATVGETAQTLKEDEFLFSIFGYLEYGLRSDFTMGTLVLADFVSAPNVNGKYKFYESESNTFSLGANFLQSPDTQEGVVNATLYWDSISSESLITHTNLSLALATVNKAKDFSALKGVGTSSFQSGYEFILDDWNRVLAGPSYNFENKAVGGYLNYMWVWDHTHALLGISTTDVSKLVFDIREGYYINADLFWRY